MPLTNYSLDTFVSQEMSPLTQCNAPEIASRFPQSSYWISNFILNSIFRHRIADDGRRFAFAFLRRAEIAFTEYENARTALIEFVKAESGKPSLYFRTLHHFEATIAMLWQAYDFMKRSTNVGLLFQHEDGSDYQRLNRIYNVSRHFNPTALPTGHIHPIWITNEGLQIDGYGLSFSEIGDLMVEVGNLADRVSSLEPKQEGST